MKKTLRFLRLAILAVLIADIGCRLAIGDWLLGAFAWRLICIVGLAGIFLLEALGARRAAHSKGGEKLV